MNIEHAIYTAIIGVGTLLAFPAAAQVGGSCDTLPEAGQCMGNNVLYCDDMTMSVAAFDCGLVMATCEQTRPDWGFDCAVDVGASCAEYQMCRGEDSACVWTSDPAELELATCVANVAPCSDAEITASDQEASSCRGQELVEECRGDQPTIVQCSSYGATCSNGICAGAREGSLCYESITCAQGLDCVPFEAGETAGTCEAPEVEPPDAGAAGFPDAAPPQGRDAGTSSTRDAGASGAPDAGASNNNNNDDPSLDLDPMEEEDERTTVDDGGCSVVRAEDQLSLILLGLGLFLANITRKRR